MIDVDLEQFVSTGILGPINSSSTRLQIEQFLGVADADGYPEFATYGHLSFDLAGGVGPPCSIQIAFPHSSHMTPADPSWANWIPPTCFNDWPEKRLRWKLGRFTPGFSIGAAKESLDSFDESEMISSTNGLRILHNAKSGVDLMFERDSDTGDVTLVNMVAYAKPIAE